VVDAVRSVQRGRRMAYGSRAGGNRWGSSWCPQTADRHVPLESNTNLSLRGRATRTGCMSFVRLTDAVSSAS
jgi:hypothetical protein